MNDVRPAGQAHSARDDAARAAWLYYVGGQTQEQIARALGISRQRAQRLVSRAVAEGLVHVRLEHPIAACAALEDRLASRFGLRVARVAPSLGLDGDPIAAIAPVAADELERLLGSPEPLVFSFGTGRALRATIEELRAMECEHHRLVSLIGNIAPDGSASFYDVIMRIADKVRAPHFPMPLPVIAATPEEREIFHALAPVRRVFDLARRADVTFVGIGEMDAGAPLLKDGFITAAEHAEMQAAGAAGEIAAWVFDEHGRYQSGGINTRSAGVRIDPPVENLVIAVAAGPGKCRPIAAALAGRLVNGLITDEPTAAALLG